MRLARNVAALLLIVLASACASAGGAQSARQTLFEFFDHLANDEYDQAVDLYGGEYEQLLVFNPDVDPMDRAELWRRACNASGLQCLPVASAALKSQVDGTFTFTVEFKQPDGSVFTLGPCCGATATEMPPVSQFDVRVQRTAQGTYAVLDLPPYVP